jgi:hypothetical protein
MGCSAIGWMDGSFNVIMSAAVKYTMTTDSSTIATKPCVVLLWLSQVPKGQNLR